MKVVYTQPFCFALFVAPCISESPYYNRFQLYQFFKIMRGAALLRDRNVRSFKQHTPHTRLRCSFLDAQGLGCEEVDIISTSKLMPYLVKRLLLDNFIN